MVARDAAPRVPTAPSRHYWLRTVAAAIVALIVSVSISVVGHNAAWPHSQSIAFAVFLFLIPVLQPLFQGYRLQGWSSRLGLGLIFAAVGGFLHAFVLNR